MSKAKIVSVSLDSEMHEAIKSASNRLGHKNASQVVRDLISKYLGLLVNETDDVPVIIRVPGEVLGDDERLRSWLRSKAEAIADALA
jgi:Arc/MetJ-type ribon-helix-helix transcriptional regulator